MRKIRDYDAELKALNDKARQLKARKQSQLGELVMATGADELTPEELAGALLVAAGTSDPGKREAWRKRGAAFFHGERDDTGNRAGSDQGGIAKDAGSAPSASSETGAA
jgi:hypothetical protein